MLDDNERRKHARRITIAGISLFFWCFILVYGTYIIGGWTLAAPTIFPFSSLGIYLAWVYSNVRQLKLTNNMPFKYRKKAIINAAGGVKIFVLVVFGITFGTIGIIVLNAI